MKHFVKIVLVVLLFSSGNDVLIAQQGSSDVVTMDTVNYSKSGAARFVPDYRFGLSTSFGSFTPGVGLYAASLSAEAGDIVLGRIRISAGMSLGAVFIGNTRNRHSLLFDAPLNYGSLFVKGEYVVNKSITVTALGYKTMNLRPSLTGEEQLNPHALDLSNQGMMINLNYKVNDNFQINATLSYNKGYYNPYFKGINNGNFNNPAINGFGTGFHGFYPY